MEMELEQKKYVIDKISYKKKVKLGEKYTRKSSGFLKNFLVKNRVMWI